MSEPRLVGEAGYRARMRPGVVMRASAAIGVVAALVVSSVVAAARQSDPPARVFTAEQASSGKETYVRACASCHLPDLSGNNDAPALAGMAFTSSWGPRTTKDLFDYMSAAMPPSGSSLEPDAYLSIMAYVLQTNGAPAGSEQYTASTALPIAGLLPPRPTSGP